MPGPRGPLPDPNRRRRNQPTIPTTALPVSGRQGRAPTVPSWANLGKVGKAWWRWAWRTPQAAAWGTFVGMESVVARRASLEDDMAALENIESLNLDDLLDAEDSAAALRSVILRLAALATGRLQLMREMRELDDRLGLTPKGLAALRWKIVDDQPADDQPAPEGVPSLDERRQRLTSAS